MVTAALSVVASALFLLYNSIMLSLIRRTQDKDTRAVEREAEGRVAGGSTV